jgi:hypothetical protein
MWTGKDVTGSFYDKFEVLCGLGHVIEEEIMT